LEPETNIPKTADDIGLVRRLINATRNSLCVLGVFWREQAALRYDFYVLVVVAPVGWYLGRSGVERALLIGSYLLVIVIELVNSAVETVVDRIGRERHELSGRTKDLASAAVLAAIVNAAVVWILILLGQR
jgi:diacylglycerol kinase (ATP)